MSDLIDEKDEIKEKFIQTINALTTTIAEDKKIADELLKKFVALFDDRNFEAHPAELVEYQKTITKLLDSRQQTTEQLIKILDIVNKSQSKEKELNFLSKNLKKGIDFKDIVDL